jgi:hypothetical protein
MYRARVVTQSADLRLVDVIPEDTRGLVPPMSSVPLRHGIPGMTVAVAPGLNVLVGWENGRPNRPFAALWEHASPGGILAVTINGQLLRLGGGVELQPLVNGVLTGEDIEMVTGLPQWMLGNGSVHVVAKKL